MSEVKQTNNGKNGGLLKGKPHYDKNGNSLGGIKAVVTDSDKPVELEGGEVIINKHAAKKHWRELSKINQSAGNGVPISEPIFKKGGNLNSEDKKDIYAKWKSLVNMSYMELNDFYNSEEGKKAGLKPKDANKLGIDYGRESARWILKMKKTKVDNWTPAMWKWANKQISFISRMSGAKGDLYDDKGNKTRKYLSLLIWGHNPKKFNRGGKIVTYKNKYNKKYGYDKNESHNLSEISKDTGVSKKGLQQIYNKGVGAYKTNPQSVRQSVHSEEQWAMGRVYSAVMGGKASKVDAHELKMSKGGLIAPNGKPSNLTSEQYKLVRTPEFKAWFGDWENDPANASKVVDDNGEPLVCYHSSNKIFNKFDYELSYDGAIWFTENLQKLKDNEAGASGSGIIYKVFLNIRKLGNWDDYDKGIAILLNDKFNGAKMDDDYIVFEPNQIKLADGTNTTFDSSNSDIRYAGGGRVKKQNKGGDCYQAAGNFIIDNIIKGEKFYLVHAQVVGQGAIQGIKYGHAWIEDKDGNVRDYSNGRNLIIPKQIYYMLGGVKEKEPIYYKYTAEEARNKMLKTGHYGPWDLKTETGL